MIWAAMVFSNGYFNLIFTDYQFDLNTKFDPNSEKCHIKDRSIQT